MNVEKHEYKVYFKINGRGMNVQATATSPEDAREQVLGKLPEGIAITRVRKVTWNARSRYA